MTKYLLPLQYILIWSLISITISTDKFREFPKVPEFPKFQEITDPQDPPNPHPRSLATSTLPSEFDSRSPPTSKSLWSSCLPPILNQGMCGSCFAHTTASVFSHRLCILSGGATKPDASPEELTGCERFNDGCEGGIEHHSFEYIEREGISSRTCMPYSYASFVPKEKDDYICPFDVCTGSGTLQKWFCSEGSTMVIYNEQLMKQAIYDHGMVSTGIMIMDDFESFSGTGIYEPASGAVELGMHAVALIGWGTGYWIAQNSWGSTWGDGGYFKVKTNVSKILDGGAHFCKPDL